MENRRTIIPKLILGGALLSAFLLAAVMPVFAYDQDNTHPALTDEIVDLFNLSFSDKKLTEEEKQWLIKGSIDEDTLERPLYHFYDPVYNRGIAGISSKDWATKEGAQAAYYNSQFTGFAAISGGDSANDFSYPRALNDYAKGDRKRAFVAFGHTLHLLEDAGVPDHTRNDAHPSFIHGQESPYEAEMAKWSPQNFQVARSLFLKREKPVSLSNIESYFDKVANYSNNNFFSKDTISNEKYSSPNTQITDNIKVAGQDKLFIVGKDKNGQEFPLAFIDLAIVNGKKKIIDITLSKPEIGSYILDGYWNRLSKEVVINGAGALRLFLEEAEKEKQEYLAKAEQKKPSFWAQILGVFGIGKLTTTAELTTPRVEDNEELMISDGQRTSDVTTPDVVYPQVTNDGDKTGDSGDTSGDKKVSPSLSPVLSPKLKVSPSVSPHPSPEATEGKASPTPKLTTADGQRTSAVKTGRVVINEIAWAGTEASTADEWIELYNTENYDIDISGWILKAEDGTPDIVIEGGNKELITSDGQRTPDVSDVKIKIIKANSYFLLERTNDTTVNSITADQIYTGALGNEGESLKLSDSSGAVVDTAGNSGGAWLAGSSTGKISMERTPDGNWKNFTGNPSAKDANGNFIYGTPKALNSPGIIMVTGGGGSGGGGSSSVTPTPSPSSPTPTPSPTPDPSPLLQVVINEIAWMGTASSVNNEWIELRNTTNQTINLTGWTLTAQDGTPNITLSGSISPLGFFLLERTSDNTLPSVIADQIYTGALGNGGEFLILKDISGTVINQIDSTSGWPAGDNTTKETAQKFGNVWKTAEPTPKVENKENVTSNAPSAVINLAAAHNSPTVTTTWSAPDPGAYKRASLSYDLRYATTNFPDDTTWDAATKVASASLPSVGEKGASESASFDVAYDYGQTYYFALKTKVINITTCDVVNADKCSAISNVAMVSFPTAVDPGSWAMFGKDQYHTSFANVTGPGLTATVSWEYNVGSGYSMSQPVVSAGGDVYFGASQGANSKLIKLDKNGSKQWEYATNVGPGTPAVLSGGIVYFGRIGAGGVLAFTALNPDGSKKWDYDDASKVEHISVSKKGEPHFTFQSGSQEKLLVLNTDGSVKTTITGSGLAGFAPVVLDSGTIITAKYISGNQFFNAYSADGSQFWPAELFYTGTNGNAPVNLSHDKSTGKTYSAAGPKLFSIPSDGLTLNSTDIAPWDYSSATIVAISADTLYLGFNGPSSNLTANEGSIFVNDASIGATDWTNPDRAKIENNSYATVLLEGAGSASKYLKATGFNFNIPANSTINGIKVEIRKSSAGEQIKDLSVRIVKNGNISGDNKADLNSWPSGAGTYVVYGGESDLWGLSLTPSDINAGGFGAAIAATLSVNGQHVGGIDNIKITVYYTKPFSLYALNKADLATSWSFQAEGRINQQIAVGQNGNTYFSTQNGKLYRVNPVGVGALIVNSGSNSTISPVLTEHGLVWGYGNKVIRVSD